MDKTRSIIMMSFAWLCLTTVLWAEKVPGLLLAEKYRPGTDLSQYWVSEKLDGVRAYWDGQHLISRQGNEFHAPEWFTKKLPDRLLDGELWIGRGKFSKTISTVSKDTPIGAEWRKIRYMIFELPNEKGTFTERVAKINSIVNAAALPHLRAVQHYKIENKPELLQAKLEEIITSGGEGLMLHRADALYHSGRSNDLLKVKSYEDAEALVIRHLPGKGKYTGMLGALLVETPQGIRFRIGTGFSDKERANPPPVDSYITYKFFGRTSKGIPRFASYMHQYSTPH